MGEPTVKMLGKTNATEHTTTCKAGTNEQIAALRAAHSRSQCGSHLLSCHDASCKGIADDQVRKLAHSGMCAKFKLSWQASVMQQRILYQDPLCWIDGESTWGTGWHMSWKSSSHRGDTRDCASHAATHEGTRAGGPLLTTRASSCR